MQVYCSQLFSTEGHSPSASTATPTFPAVPPAQHAAEKQIQPRTAMHDWTANQLCAATRAMNRNSSSGTPASYSRVPASPSTLAERRLDVSMAKLTLEPDLRARPGRLFSDHPGKSLRRGGGGGGVKPANVS
ncbi:hypothetical protein H2199_000284 [Coniosporium tulheliwenetii]|uniref:Uncharacterized protein n=1 Tax=Coniosporium tulheliwenetii TaxID=3383036 RepID=A0ACC2ZQ39_9PEZI|nr:hypothetical protein H2199_000284 [Cladosporium sp. JES 115]